MGKWTLLLLGLGGAGVATEHTAVGHDWMAKAHQWACQIGEATKALEIQRRDESREDYREHMTEAERNEIDRYLERPRMDDVLPNFDEATRRTMEAVHRRLSPD